MVQLTHCNYLTILMRRRKQSSCHGNPKTIDCQPNCAWTVEAAGTNTSVIVDRCDVIHVPVTSDVVRVNVSRFAIIENFMAVLDTFVMISAFIKSRFSAAV